MCRFGDCRLRRLEDDMEIFTRTIALLLWGFDLILFGAMLFGGLIVLITMSKAMLLGI